MQGFGMGRYRPPDVDPTSTSFNAGRHPLGPRARKLDQGILIVRFELPFNVWCNGCGNHIGQGVRYNAEKKHVGDYLSTKVWGFRCKCHLCSAWFEIRTDPKNARYIVHEGAREQHRDWDPSEHGGHPIYDDGTGPSSVPSSSSREKEGEGSDAFSRLEKRESQRTRAAKLTERVLELEAHSDARWKDPYTLNAKLRDGFRREKRVRTQQLLDDLDTKRRIGWREDALLLPPPSSTSDERASGKGDGDTTPSWKQKWDEQRLAIQAREIESGAKAREYSPIVGGHRRVPPKRDASAASTASRAPPSKLKQRSDSSSRSSYSSSKPSGNKDKSKANPSSSSAAAGKSLRRALVAKTRKKQDPFLQQLERHARPTSPPPSQSPS